MDLGSILEARARAHGDKVFALFENQKIKYEEFNHNTNKIANSLYELGVRKGDHIAALMPNHIDFVYLFFAVAKLGAVCVFIDTNYNAEFLKHAIQISDSKVAVIGEDFYGTYQQIRAHLDKVEIEIAYPNNKQFRPNIKVSFDDFFNGSMSRPPFVSIKSGDIVQFIFTSGTTGFPKPCIISHNARIAASEHVNKSLAITSEDVFYACLPNYHGNVYHGINGALLAGGSFALGKNFSVSKYWDEVRRYKASILVLHITPMNLLAMQPIKTSDWNNPARASLFAVGPYAKEFLKRFNIKTGLVLYGTTETGGFTTMSACDIKNFPEDPRFCGKSRDDFEVKIVNDEDEELSVGEIGEIIVRPRKPFVMYGGYYNMPGKTVEKIQNLYFHTGDLGFQDVEGNLYFLERKDDSIRVKGNFVSAEHIESIIRAHPKVKETAAIGVASEIGEQDIKIFIQPLENAEISPIEIISYCQEHLSGYFMPRYVEFIDCFPVASSALKIQKAELRKRGIGHAWDGKTGKWV